MRKKRLASFLILQILSNGIQILSEANQTQQVFQGEAKMERTVSLEKTESAYLVNAEVTALDELSAEELDVIAGGCDTNVNIHVGPRINIGKITARFFGRFGRR